MSSPFPRHKIKKRPRSGRVRAPCFRDRLARSTASVLAWLLYFSAWLARFSRAALSLSACGARLSYQLSSGRRRQLDPIALDAGNGESAQARTPTSKPPHCGGQAVVFQQTHVPLHAGEVAPAPRRMTSGRGTPFWSSRVALVVRNVVPDLPRSESRGENSRATHRSESERRSARHDNGVRVVEDHSC